MTRHDFDAINRMKMQVLTHRIGIGSRILGDYVQASTRA